MDNQGNSNTSPTPQGADSSTETAQPAQAVVPQAAGGQQRVLHNTSFWPPILNAPGNISRLMVLCAYGVATNPPGHQKTGNKWHLYLTCIPRDSNGDIPRPLNVQLLERIRISAEADLLSPVPAPRRGFYAKTDVVVLDYARLDSVATKSLPIRATPGTRFLDRSFPVDDVLALMGSKWLDWFEFDESGRGSHNWFWILVCALGKYQRLRVPQESWDKLYE